jgi:serine phosphatase RsbU (regulator of sigma subunit)
MEISPAWILGFFNNKLKILLNQTSSASISNVGFDGTVTYYNKKNKIIKISSAESIMFTRDTDGTISTIKGTRKSVGYKQVPFDFVYEEQVFEAKEGMKLYLTTDGYIDQNGGPKGFPMGKTRFMKIIEDFGGESMADQQEMFLYELDAYESEFEDHERNDDVTVIGITI